jgi:hypothetical protein
MQAQRRLVQQAVCMLMDSLTLQFRKRFGCEEATAQLAQENDNVLLNAVSRTLRNGFTRCGNGII